ncbi:ATP-dependent zinc metalloprotease FtsH [Achromobacter ruhlandii]|uniref:hypothetical protein n=1 Tax=Achromobacter ruhlandii TaxID=72557 RepID=UPI0014669ACE|nr:hypothetical protein [Achromobacter ruhlandii]CAB3730943.1 ATP-dependent zinc metalloprotease FtsH [Achromobacter ruhlandii]
MMHKALSALVSRARALRFDRIPSGVLLALRRYGPELAIALGCYAAISSPSSAAPMNAAVVELLQWVSNLGAIAVVVMPLFHLWWDGIASLGAYFIRVARGMAVYVLLVAAIRRFGDELYQWAVSNPSELGMLVVVTCSVLLILRAMRGDRVYSQAQGPTYAAAGLLGRFSARNLSGRDRQFAAAHEVGHAILHAALPKLPAAFNVRIFREPNNEGTAGQVVATFSEDLFVQADFAEWYMLMLLAGKAAEAHVMGNTALGSAGDYTRWTELARDYLANHQAGIYYGRPRDMFDHQHNEARLASLQAQQLKTLRDFLRLNSDVVNSLVAQLVDQGSLTADDVRPLFNRVAFPEGFPLQRSMDETPYGGSVGEAGAAKE